MDGISAKRNLLTIVLVSVALLGMQPAANAYDKGGHLFSVAMAAVAAMQTTGPSHLTDNEARIVSFCTWLPDESEELNAVTAYDAMSWSDWTYWSLGGTPRTPVSASVHRMITVQQLLHGLTGGDSIAVQHAADTLIKTFRKQIQRDHDNPSQVVEDACALGFAFHLYGDSFAHVDPHTAASSGPKCDDSATFLPRPPAPAGPHCAMYPTGRGHFVAAHHPDRPIYSDSEWKKWVSYFDSLYMIAGTAPKIDGISAQCQQEWDLREDDHEPCFEQHLVLALKPQLRPQSIKQCDSGMSLAQCIGGWIYGKENKCDAKIADAVSSGRVPNELQKLKCSDIWSHYREQAEPLLVQDLTRGPNYRFPRSIYQVALFPEENQNNRLQARGTH